MVELMFLPPNTTAIIQPCDQGIIQNLKVHYRSNIVCKLINDIESSTENQLEENQLARKLTILDAVHALKKAWSAVTSTTIVNCFKKGGFHIPDNTDLQTDEVITPLETPPEMTATSFEEYVDIDNNLPCTGLPTDDDICASMLAENADNRDVNPADSDDEEVHPAVRPTSSELLSAVATIRQGFEFGNIDFDYLYYVEDQVSTLVTKIKRQTVMTEFLQWCS